MSGLLQSFRILCKDFHKTRLPKRLSVALFSAKPPRQGIVKETDPKTGTLKTKKTPIAQKITLVSQAAVDVITLQEAENLSKRRDMKLVKIVDADAKTERPVYKLMTGAEYHAEDLKQRERNKLERQQRSTKGEKVLLLNTRITPHDLMIHLRKALKWIRKTYEVRVIISGGGSSAEAAEKIYSDIEQYFKTEEGDAKLVQKKCKGSDIKFQITPPRHKDTTNQL
ncbi:translation initiation factor IF-3, mitochondrial [Zophobas morio]|uniref:translation initiation factor IF-3, mitochondrial n=1 Tax=Zophobas morio TaxID=2755281 RepID=UPI0030838B52